MKLNPHTFRPGDWVWYFYPRRRTGRSPKWERLYTGPFLVIDQVGPVNFIIQKAQRADPLVVHVDKLKFCESKTPSSWLLPTASGESGPDNQSPPDVQTINTNTKEGAQLSTDVTDQPGTGPSSPQMSSKRLRKPPKWAADYVTSFSPQDC